MSSQQPSKPSASPSPASSPGKPTPLTPAQWAELEAYNRMLLGLPPVEPVPAARPEEAGADAR